MNQGGGEAFGESRPARDSTAGTNAGPRLVASRPTRRRPMPKAKAFAAASPTAALAGTTIPRRDVTDRDVQIEILFCGVCHSDLHTARDEWHEMMPTVYPCVPGHEIIGRVSKVGGGVEQIQGRRPRRRRLHGRVRPRLPQLPRRLRAVLPERDLHLQQPGQARDGPRHLRRVFGQRRRARGRGAPHPGESRPGRGGPAALRRDHDLLAPQAKRGRARARRWASSASAGSGTWA